MGCIARFAVQYYEVIVCPPKKCAMVAHFYETIAHFFGEPPKSWHFCIRNRGVVCPDVNKKPYQHDKGRY